jgi:F-type H+-transporting ATPase subunit epsilon
MAIESTEGTLQCVVVTPERAVVDEPADFVALPMYDGELGVLPGRAPLIGRLGFGELRIRRGSTTRYFFIDSGFAQIRQNVVTVLTPRALRGEEIDPRAAAQKLDEAKTPAPTPEGQEEHEKDQKRARAQLRVAHHVRGEHAV